MGKLGTLMDRCKWALQSSDARLIYQRSSLTSKGREIFSPFLEGERDKAVLTTDLDLSNDVLAAGCENALKKML